MNLWPNLRLKIRPRLKPDLKPFEQVAVGYLLLLSVIVFIFRENLSGLSESWLQIEFYHFCGIAAIVAISCLRFSSTPGFFGKILRVFRDFYIFPSYLIFYRELGLLNKMVFGRFFTDTVIAWEEAVFGSQPAVWLADWVGSPLITEIFNIGYFSYYFLFPVLGIALYRNKDKEVFQHYTFAITSTFLACYMIYVFFPAKGACWVFPEADLSTVKGYFFTNVVISMQGNGVSTAAFPSSHVAASVVVLWYAFMYDRRMAKILTPFVVFLIPGTVYGKYHFAVDALAGIAWGLFLAWITTWIWPKLGWRSIENSKSEESNSCSLHHQYS